MSTLLRLIRDRSALLGLIVIAVLVLAAVFAYPLATFPQDVTNYDPPHRLLPPSGTYWFGTDRMGGDIYSRLRERSDAAKTRFSKERDASKALAERKKCLTKLAGDGFIPAEVLASLPAPEEIQRKAAEAAAKAKAALAMQE